MDITMDGDIRGDLSLASVLLHTPHRGISRDIETKRDGRGYYDVEAETLASVLLHTLHGGITRYIETKTDGRG